MPYAVDRDVVQPMTVVVVQVEVDQSLNGSSLYGRNRQYA
jgi:hypothetical protein